MQITRTTVITNPETGESLTCEEWAIKFKVTYYAFKKRLLHHKTPDKIFYLNNKIPIKLTHPETGESLTYDEWAWKLGTTKQTLKCRKHRNKDLRMVLTESRAKRIFTHPDTGESLPAEEWIKRLNISLITLYDREKAGLDIRAILSPKRKQNSYDRWRKEEDDLILEVLFLPNLCKEYNKLAKKWGLRSRTDAAIKTRIVFLRKKGKVPIIRGNALGHINTGVIKLVHLAENLRINKVTAQAFISRGLKHEYSGRQVYIKLSDFAEWAVNSIGSSMLANKIRQDEEAMRWVLMIIGKWLWNYD